MKQQTNHDFYDHLAVIVIFYVFHFYVAQRYLYEVTKESRILKVI